MIKFENGDMKKSLRNFQIILWIIFSFVLLKQTLLLDMCRKAICITL